MNKRDTILIVDDMEMNRAILRGVFEKNYNLLEAENGEQALLLIEQYHSNIAVMLLDLIMPIKNGYQVMQEIGNRGLLGEVPVVVITAEDFVESEVQAFDLGASDIIKKPFEPHVVKRRVQNIVELNLHKLNQEELIEEQAEKLRQSNEVMVDTLSSIIEYRSEETGQHIQRIRLFAKVLLDDVVFCYPEYGLTERDSGIIASASSMHDIGKIAIPDSVLDKPGRLTAEEFETMKQHTIKGCEMLSGLEEMGDEQYLQYAYNICRYHHERWDGKGYPDGLKGESIPICAQVVGIADCYDALTTDRVYRKALPSELAFNMILNGECGAFSPKLLESFKNVRMLFEQLSREYADGTMPMKAMKSVKMQPAKPSKQDMLNTNQMGRTKYLTLLRYADATVMEVDMNTGMYHVVYMSGNDFQALRYGNSFYESFRAFMQEAVHPEDRERLLDEIETNIDEFFNEGLMKRVRRYRVLNRDTRTYRWCNATMMRIDTGHPHQRQAMLIWNDCEDATAVSGSGIREVICQDDVMRNLLGGINQHLNDQWYTMTQVNEGFLNLIGYTEQELQDKFQNRFTELIYPPDRDEVKNQVREQMKTGNFIVTEYRLVGRDGRLIWVLEKCQNVLGKDGQEYLFCVLIEITQTKKAQEEVRRMVERHKILLDQTNDIIFEWDIEKDYVSYSSNWIKKLGYSPIEENASERIPKVSHVHPEELQRFLGLIDELKAGLPYGEIEFRLADSSGRYRWFKIRVTAQYMDMGKPYRAVGVMTDIDDEMRVSQKLKDKAERDSLTDLLNKSAARKKIEFYLNAKKASEKAAILIIDVDNFKQINDNYGHMFGDAVLQEIASDIRSNFRDDDVLARIGGDEFLVFMKNISGTDAVISRAERLITSFRELFNQDAALCSLSCSIGAAFCPEDGDSFPTLFSHGDLALYKAKSQCKNQFVLYDKTTMDKYLDNTEGQTAAGTGIESDEKPETDINTDIEWALQLLYGAKNLENAVNMILESMGNRFSVSRVYIFESTKDDKACANTFEWCADGIVPEKEKFQNFEYTYVNKDYRSYFNDDDIFYCTDIKRLPDEIYRLLEPQGIKSVLQCAIKDDGKFCGFIGFDDCLSHRIWTQEQTALLSLTAKLLSAFLLKKRAQDRLEDSSKYTP